MLTLGSLIIFIMAGFVAGLIWWLELMPWSSRWIVFWDAINAPISRRELIGSYKFRLRPVAGVRRTELHAQPCRQANTSAHPATLRPN